MGVTVSRGRHVVARVYGLRVGYGTNAIPVFPAARLVHRDKYEGTRRSYPHNEVRCGCVLSCPTQGNAKLVTDKDCGGSALQFYCVEAVLRGPDGRLWAARKPMERSQSSVGRGWRAQHDKVTVVLLCDAVRRAGTAHICDDQCVPHRRQLLVNHSATVADGGLYEVWTRVDGYPPYMGQPGPFRR